jgi:phospholipid transport system substrate-binding protein
VTKHSRLWAISIIISAFALVPTGLKAGEPTQQLSHTINSFIAILMSTPVAELQARGLPESARQLIFARFDFTEMTRRSLGSHWKALNPGEQNEFITAFTQRLLYTYGRTLHSYGGEKIQFDGEVQEQKQASVETKVTGDSGENLAIAYRLHDVDGQWKVYDVVIDHVSLVSNYRAQFARVIAKSSLHDLLQKIKVKPHGS